MELQIYEDSTSSSGEEDFEMYINIIPEERIFRDRTNLFESLSDEEFHQRFRLTKECVSNLLHIIGPNITPITQRNRSITAVNQLLLTLRFLATGTFQNIIGDVIGIHKSTVCRILKKVLSAIAELSVYYIEMPSTPEHIANVKTQFAAMYGFPNVIGCVDGTHIKIQSPGGENAERYRNRKGYFSYNVQVVCAPNLKIQSIDARWPGSTHDSTIFNASLCKINMEEELQHCILLGDSAYPCKKFLMTPILNPANDAEVRYNYAQIRTRNCIERCFGVWKRRFPALALGMRTAKATTLIAIVAAAVLHNIASDDRHIFAYPEIPFEEMLQDVAPPLEGNDGYGTRRALIQNHFL